MSWWGKWGSVLVVVVLGLVFGIAGQIGGRNVWPIVAAVTAVLLYGCFPRRDRR